MLLTHLFPLIENAHRPVTEDAYTRGELAAMVDRAATMGVKLSIGGFGGSAIDLGLIGRKPEAPKGAGAEVMRMLCQWADERGVSISTYVMGGPAAEKLWAFYEGFGFVVDESMDDEAYMIRRPRAAISEGIYDEEGGASQEWRAWIDPKGEVHDVHGEETHAEWAYGHQVTDDDWEAGIAANEAFSTQIENGWIRVGVNFGAAEFYTTLKEEFTTVAALESLLRMVQETPADRFSITDKHALLPKARFRALLTRMLVQKKKRGANLAEGRFLDYPRW